MILDPGQNWECLIAFTISLLGKALAQPDLSRLGMRQKVLGNIYSYLRGQGESSGVTADSGILPRSSAWWRSPIFFAFTMAVSIFLVECIVMFILSRLPAFPGAWEGVLDAALLVVLISPVLYFLIFDPLTNQIAECERVELALRESEEKYRSLFEDSKDGVYITSLEGRFLSVNQSIAELLGYSRKELIDLDVNDLYVCPEDRIRFHETIKRDGSVRDFEAKLRKRDGTEMDCLLTSTVRRGQNGSIAGYQGIIRDITQQKTAEAEILRAQKLESLGILADGLAHDFNNFLMTILSNITNARLIAKADEKVQEVLKAAEHAIDRAKAITRQLSTFTRGGKTMKDTVYLTPLLKEAVQFALHGTRVRPEFHLAHDLSPVHIDSGQINQVINNLVINAMQAMPQGGRLMISTSNVTFKGKAPPGPLKADEYVKVDVQDAGVGILPEIIGKIFDPYVTSKKEGTGLGLFSCFSILNQHQGWITVESELGQGSTFTFYLPAASEPAPTESRPVAES